MSEMSHEEAVQALQDAAAIDPDFGGTPPAPEQAQPTPVATPEGEKPNPAEQPAPEASDPVAQPEAQDSETFFNPDALDPALIPAWKQLQAAYTQKTQSLAEQRKQLEALGGPEVVAEAVELYSRISDPANWPQLHAELSEAMQEAGLTPAQADALAAEELQRQATGSSSLDGLNLDDPDIAPLASALKEQSAQVQSLRQMVEALTGDLSMRAESEALERQQQEHAMKIRNDLMSIKASRPDYDDDDLRAIIERAPFFNDDIHAAQASYEADIARRLDRYFASKEAAKTPSIQPQPGAGSSSVVDDTPRTLAEAGAEAEELLRNLQAAGELDF
ncbi:MAG: hypothetical protein LC118_08005 [Dehalococcoidia bacterium]|nr:hypothetical protein [Dehalococcoidia bacterium]